VGGPPFTPRDELVKLSDRYCVVPDPFSTGLAWPSNVTIPLTDRRNGRTPSYVEAP